MPDDPDAKHWAYGALNLPAAWDMTTGSPEIVIAVVDSYRVRPSDRGYRLQAGVQASNSVGFGAALSAPTRVVG